MRHLYQMTIVVWLYKNYTNNIMNGELWERKSHEKNSSKFVRLEASTFQLFAQPRRGGRFRQTVGSTEKLSDFSDDRCKDTMLMKKIPCLKPSPRTCGRCWWKSWILLKELVNQGRSRKGEKINAAIREHDKWFRMEDLKLKLHEYTDKIWKGNASRLKQHKWMILNGVIIWSSYGHQIQDICWSRMLATDWLARIHKSRWLAMLNPRWPNTPWRCDPPKKRVEHEVHSRWDPTRIERCLSFGMSFWELFFFPFFDFVLTMLIFHMF